MTDQFPDITKMVPITPPPELLDQWLKIPEVITPITKMAVVTVTTNRLQMLATEAARWGADQELKACVKWLKEQRGEALAIHLRTARRPKPPSLKAQALNELQVIRKTFEHQGLGSKTPALDAALERLGELEQLDD